MWNLGFVLRTTGGQREGLIGDTAQSDWLGGKACSAENTFGAREPRGSESRNRSLESKEDRPQGANWCRAGDKGQILEMVFSVESAGTRGPIAGERSYNEGFTAVSRSALSQAKSRGLR